ncbi:MAG: M67 family metallopeptidase [Candidatus Krumholzibacteria bacterium]
MISIHEKLLKELRCHARQEYPRECCGALIGKRGVSTREVLAVVPLDNQRRGTAALRRFLVSAGDYRRLEKHAAERKLDVLGFYHSHPDHRASPSAFDREHALPWYAYVIVGVDNGNAGEITCWTLSEDRSRFVPEPITVGH